MRSIRLLSQAAFFWGGWLNYITDDVISIRPLSWTAFFWGGWLNYITDDVIGSLPPLSGGGWLLVWFGVDHYPSALRGRTFFWGGWLNYITDDVILIRSLS